MADSDNDDDFKEPKNKVQKSITVSSFSISLDEDDEVVAEDSMSSCFVCKQPLAGMSSVEKNAHLNACLDSGGPKNDNFVAPMEEDSNGILMCPVCQKDLGHLSEASRSAHINRCYDGTLITEQQVHAAVAAVRNNSNSLDGPQYHCVVCGKDLSAASPLARSQHVKSCSKKNHISPSQFRRINAGFSDGSLVAPPAPPTTSKKAAAPVYTDLESGFQRSIVSGKKNASSSKRAKKNARANDDLMVADDEELSHVGIALQRSLGAVRSLEEDADDEVVVGSVLKEGEEEEDDEDGGEEKPRESLTQIVADAVPLAPKQDVQVTSLPQSRLGSSKRSIWRMSIERPATTPTRPNDVQKNQDPPPPPPQPVTPDVFAPPLSPPHVPSSRLEVRASVLDNVRSRLNNVSVSYEKACRDALEAAQSKFRVIEDEYFMVIGRAAVDRDASIRAIMSEFGLHAGHMDSLPMQSYSAAPPPTPQLKLPTPAAQPEVIVVDDEHDDKQKEEVDGLDVLADQLLEEPFSPIVVPEGEPVEDHFLDSPGSPPATSKKAATTASPGVSVVKYSLPQKRPAPGPASPMPNYDDMSLEDLKAKMEEFGLNAGTEKFMREKLKEIWRYQHGQLSESLLAAKKVQSQGLPLDVSVTPIRPTKKVNIQDDAQAPAPVEENDQIAVALTGDLEADITAFIKNGVYFEKVIAFEQVQLLQLQEDLLAAGIKVSKKNLRSYLDSKCVDFFDPESKFR